MSSSIIFSYLANGIVILSAIYLVHQKIKKSELRQYYFSALAFKIICTIFLGLLYTQFYQGGDITTYFSRAEALSQLSLENYFNTIFSQTELSDPRRAIYFERIVSFFLLITKSDFWVISVYFSLLCFFSTCYFLFHFNRAYPNARHAVFIAFLFFPSVVFWSSGLVKETVAFASMIFLAGMTLKLSARYKTTWFEWLSTTSAIFFLGAVKYYIVASFLPFLLACLFYSYKKLMSSKQWYLSILGLVLFLAATLPFIHPNLNPNLFFKSIEIARITLILNSDAQNIVTLYYEANPFVNGIVNFFILLFSGIFRPVLFESFDFPTILATIENTLLLALFFSRFFGLFSINKKQTVYIAMIASYIIIMAVLFTYSTPNLGTLSRFKVYYMPFFVFLVLLDHPVINWLKQLKQKNL